MKLAADKWYKGLEGPIGYPFVVALYSLIFLEGKTNQFGATWPAILNAALASTPYNPLKILGGSAFLIIFCKSLIAINRPIHLGDLLEGLFVFVICLAVWWFRNRKGFEGVNEKESNHAGKEKRFQQ